MWCMNSTREEKIIWLVRVSVYAIRQWSHLVLVVILLDRNVVRYARSSWNGMVYGVHAVVIDYRLRTRSRNSKFKAELRASNAIDKAKLSIVYEQPPIQALQKHIAHKRSVHLRPKLSNIKWISIVAKKTLKSMYQISIFHTFSSSESNAITSKKGWLLYLLCIKIVFTTIIWAEQ